MENSSLGEFFSQLEVLQSLQQEKQKQMQVIEERVFQKEEHLKICQFLLYIYNSDNQY